MRWRAHKTRGSLVLVAFCLIAVVGLGLAGYMNACYQSLNHSTREYHSRQARYLAEVGLEEALWQLNNNSPWTGSGPTSSTAWTGSNPKSLNVTGYALGSGATGEITVTVDTTTYAITSTAEVSIAGKTYTKTLTTATQRASAFPSAIASSTGTVSFSSAGAIDSYDSSTQYNTGTPANRTYNAVIAGSDVNLTNADVMGYLATYGDLVNNTFSYNVASASVIGSGGSGIDANRLGRSAFVPEFPVTTPTPASWSGTLTNNSTTTIGAIGGTVPQNWRFTGNYALTTATLTVQGPVRIVISGNLTITGSGRLRINNTSNAAAEIFVGGNLVVGTVGAAATNGFNNRSPSAAAPIPSRLIVYVTGSGSTVYYRSAARFDGVIYSSHANTGTMTIVSTGTTPALYGALLSRKDISFTGAAPNIHYDTDLRTTTFAAITTPFVVSTIIESATAR